MRAMIAPRAGTDIEGVDLFRYEGARPTGSLTPACGLLVRVRARRRRETMTGLGEAVVPHSRAAEAWQAVATVTTPLPGSVLPRRVDPTDPLAGVSGWQPARWRDHDATRAAKLAVEMALLDLAATAADRSLAGLCGAAEQPVPATPMPRHRLPAAAPGSTPDRLAEALERDPGEGWAVRLQSTGDPELDAAWLLRAAEIERGAGRDRPLWLVGGDLDPDRAAGYVRRLATLVGRGELPPLVLLEEPLSGQRRPRRAHLSELQRIADDVLGRKRSSPRADPQLSIVAGDSVSSVAHLRSLCDPGPVGGLHLTLSRWASLLGLREGARLAKQADPSMTVLLGGEPGSRLTATALAALAAATPELDRYAPAAPVTGWPRLAIEHDPRDHGDRRAGLFTGVDLPELSTVVDRCAELPATGGPAGPAEPNDFPDHRLPVGPWDARATSMLEVELLRGGLRTRRFSARLLLAEAPGSSAVIGFDRARSSLTSVPGFAIAAYKEVTRDVLAERGLPVAAGAHFRADQAAQARAAGMELGFPLVVKPAGGTKGIGVTTNITSEPELERAIDEVASSRYAESGMVVERFVTGNDYRVLATPDQVLSVVRREPASVTGDGRHTVEELVVAANAVRRRNPNLGKLPIQLDPPADGLLRRQRLDRRSVPEAGQRVRLSAVANLSQGGDSHEVLDSTHPSVLALGAAAVRAIPGLPYAGLDVLLEDHTRPVDEQQVAIIEVNSIPMLTMHHFPMFGPPRNVSAPLVRDVAGGAGIGLATGAAGDLAVRLTAFGRVQRVGYRRWLRGAAEQLGLECSVSNAPQPDRVDATIRGPGPQVGLLLRLAFRGPPGARVVETRVEPAGFPDDNDPAGAAGGGDAVAAARIRTCAAARSPHDPRPGRGLGSGSALLAAAAEGRGLTVRRYERDVVVCEGAAAGRVAFRGLAGPANSTVAELLCENDAWLRRQLAGQGLPTVTMRVVDLDDQDSAYRVAGAIGLPVAARLLQEPSASPQAITDAESFQRVWDQLRKRSPDSRAQVALERQVATGPVMDVAVVGGRVVAMDYRAPGDGQPSPERVAGAGALAVRAVAALPGAGYGSVRLVVDPDGPPEPGGRLVVDSVDPLLGRWSVPEDPAGPAIAEAILDFELRSAGHTAVTATGR